jgi:hypothetical protein
MCLLDCLINDFDEIDEAMFQSVESPCELIFCILVIEKKLGRSCICDIWSWGIAVRTHNFPSGRLKNWLWWIRWSDVSRCRKSMRNHFLDSSRRKKRLGRSCLSDVFCRRIVLRTHILPSWRLKKRLWWSRWNDVSRCRKAMRIHFWHPRHLGKQLGRNR